MNLPIRKTRGISNSSTRSSPRTCTAQTCTAQTCTAQTCTAQTCTAQTCTARTCTARTCTARTCLHLTCTARTCTARTCTARTCTAPDEHNPNTFDPNTFDPNAPVPDPQAYASAQNRSIIAFSSRTGTADERAVVNTWTRTGDFYVRVRGRNGVYSLASPFTVNVSIQPGLCQNLDTALVPAACKPHPATSTQSSWSTQLGWPAAPPTSTPCSPSWRSLPLGPTCKGVVVTVSQDDRVAAANLQADQKVECPEAKNLVADAINQIVQRYKALNPLEYVVIVGNDNTIPFFRTPDQAFWPAKSTMSRRYSTTRNRSQAFDWATC